MIGSAAIAFIVLRLGDPVFRLGRKRRTPSRRVTHTIRKWSNKISRHEDGVQCRAYPNPDQAHVLNRTFGCVRVAWNQTLAWRRQRYQTGKTGTTYAQASGYLTALKATDEFTWLNEVSCAPLQQAIRHQQAAYAAFFAKRARYPRFKARDGRQCAEYKAARYGRRVIVIDRWFPSSKMCSACGHVLAELGLKIRTWQCRVAAPGMTGTSTPRRTSWRQVLP